MTDPKNEPVLRVEGVSKDFGTEIRTRVLHQVDVTLYRGELVSLIGQSGSGKSTLLNIIGLLDRPTEGRVFLNGQNAAEMNEDERTEMRNRHLGFIFQFHHLIGALTAEENVALPLAIAEGSTTASSRDKARDALALVGLGDRTAAFPRQLSGGQQQRVAIARALVSRPSLILADEPTGNLDSKTSDDVFATMRDLNQRFGMAFLLVTHDPRIAERTDRVIELVDGRVAQSE